MANWASAGEDHRCSHQGCECPIRLHSWIRIRASADLQMEKEAPKAHPPYTTRTLPKPLRQMLPLLLRLPIRLPPTMLPNTSATDATATTQKSATFTAVSQDYHLGYCTSYSLSDDSARLDSIHRRTPMTVSKICSYLRRRIGGQKAKTKW